MAGKVKQLVRALILGATFVFLAGVLRDRWTEVTALKLGLQQLRWGAIAFGITAIAHLWSGWVWGWILRVFDCRVRVGWLLRVYLQTNLAKYIPGNVWHFYGRIEAVRTLGNPLGTATLSVLLEPLLMAVAAACIAGSLVELDPQFAWLHVAVPVAAIAGLHPRILTPLLRMLNRSKDNTGTLSAIRTYPWQPLCGEFGFVALRGLGFVAAIAGFHAVTLADFPTLLGAFSSAWFLGLIVPTPGGLGVFEVTALALLDTTIAPGTLLGALAIFRLLSVAAEAATAGVAWVLGHNRVG